MFINILDFKKKGKKSFLGKARLVGVSEEPQTGGSWPGNIGLRRGFAGIQFFSQFFPQFFF